MNPDNFMGAAKLAAEEKSVDTNAAKANMESTTKDLNVTGRALALGSEFKDMAKRKVENLKGQEDCLYLNLFTPRNTTSTSKNVVIYLHREFYEKHVSIISVRFKNSIEAGIFKWNIKVLIKCEN